MAQQNKTQFKADIDAWVAMSKDRMRAVFQESTQRLYHMATDNLSGTMVMVQTGFLRASARASLDAMPIVDPKGPSKGSTYGFDANQVSLVIANAKLGDTIYIGWTAVYARRIEYGFVGTDSLGRIVNQRPRPFLGSAAMQWQAIVSGVASDLQSRVTQAGMTT